MYLILVLLNPFETPSAKHKKLFALPKPYFVHIIILRPNNFEASKGDKLGNLKANR